MAPWWPSPSEADKPHRDDDPFADFRRFAEEQIGALVQGINSLPGFSSASLGAEEQHLTDEMRELRKRLEEDFPPLFASLLGAPERRSYLGGPISEEARQAARVLLLQARNASLGVNPNRILSLYQDHGQGMMPVHSKFPIRTTTSNTTWLGIDWFRHSPYSPIQLEQHSTAHQHGGKWRAAFEDLLCAHLDKPQVAYDAWKAEDSIAASDLENQTLYNQWAQPGIDWMLGLQCRGILPPQLPSLYNITPLETKKLDRVFGKIVSGVSNFWTPYGRSVYEDFTQLARIVASPDAEDLVLRRNMQPETEMDMYESLWKVKEDYSEEQASSSKATSMSNNSSVSISSSDPARSQKPSVISVMTTTEMRTIPDGTVYTKRVLKKRFSDGTEENREEESTGLPEQETGLESDGGHDKKDGAGWFWH
ncbi:hypothetical protein AUEXF2481DRAFT_40246 [Aureobasidium subglaciale EXF-2481]|uniref:Uncharacterized protein n=1 Tax=Aureobasidium subglaciale (strain EXF-2481) TaxID=1043005 RepID=A0A074YG01_AURSE|nr:uncharacterized protein AUEXF2481DRAFT_40246 [Aureobasidium subglaciale EXF-2481]KAI5211660.1 hypothetical protein E4T38_01152 [Aureobasidium subglaciale]KAI5230391.1 hypothetical protein E4T40_01153 [Aureobasidium subglaciale]KAI5233619.1 hypothetical protein E4T41_01151 [Aureobasidium subglaciale]KAI5266873.1 hypothetical protein E4T46_01151 [Aureobasidium subglaciale]KEQ94989.1 hypothetical protein AUEXF2481DRAFT_40246 [Aureobasidium subglaciale EXF-2481]